MFHPWVKKIPKRRAWQSSPVFLPGTRGMDRFLFLWTEEPGRLQSMGSRRSRHDSSERAPILSERYGPSHMPWEVIQYLCSPRGSQKLSYDSKRKENEMDAANHSIAAQEDRRGWSPHFPCWTSEPINLKAHIWTIMLMINHVLFKLFHQSYQKVSSLSDSQWNWLSVAALHLFYCYPYTHK